MIEELPILFTPGLATKSKEQLKTETRRIMKPQPSPPPTRFKWWGWERETDKDIIHWVPETNSGKVGIFNQFDWKCPYGQPGDLLYVRENWKPLSYNNDIGWRIQFVDGDIVEYPKLFEDMKDEVAFSDRFFTQLRKKGIDPEDYTEEEVIDIMPWKPNIHLPKLGSRLWLRVKEITVEQVQDIDWDGAVAEGCPGYRPTQDEPTMQFERLWDSINKSRGYGWKENPWVWVVKFELISSTGKPCPFTVE